MLGSVSGLTRTVANKRYNIGLKNIILNPCGEVNQRLAGANFATGVAPTNVLGYLCDHWLSQTTLTTTGTINYLQQTGLSPFNIPGYGLVTTGIEAACSQTRTIAGGSSEVVLMEQPIEGYYWKMVAGQPTTLSFWFYSSEFTGSYPKTYCATLRDGGSSYYSIVDFSIPTANQWYYKTVTFPAATASGTYSYTNGLGALLSFTLACGSGLQGTGGGTWTSGNKVATSNITNTFTNDVRNVVYITAIQLEASPQATVFEHRPYPMELAMCQRYYETSYGYGVLVPTASAAAGTPWSQTRTAIAATTAGTLFPGLTQFKVPKRTTPTVVLYAYDATANAVTNNSTGLTRGGCLAAQANTNGFSTIAVDATSLNAINLDHQIFFHYAANADF